MMTEEIKIPKTIWSKLGSGRCWVSVKLKDGKKIEELWLSAEGKILGRLRGSGLGETFSLEGLDFSEQDIVGVKRTGDLLAKFGLRRWIYE